MRKIRTKLLLLFAITLHQISFAVKTTPEQYIEQYKNGAIAEMKKHGIPASITLAQGMLESGNGNSTLAIKANNHFGIKCHSDWKGPSYKHDDDKRNECFRKYKSVFDSFNDHSLFLTGYSRYSFLFELKTTDYKGWAKGLKQAGYATNPKYPSLLINIIEKHELYKFDSGENYQTKPSIVKKGSDKPSDNSVSTVSKSSRKILRMGIKKYVIIKKGDTFYKIAKDTDKDLWQLYRFNNLTEKDVLVPGDKLFLQPKRNKADIEYHTVKGSETMQSISQYHGIKLKVLYRKNNMQEGSKPQIGQRLYMRKYKPTDEY